MLIDVYVTFQFKVIGFCTLLKMTFIESFHGFEWNQMSDAIRKMEKVNKVTYGENLHFMYDSIKFSVLDNIIFTLGTDR